MKKCSKCDKEIDSSYEFCINCSNIDNSEIKDNISLDNKYFFSKNEFVSIFGISLFLGIIKNYLTYSFISGIGISIFILFFILSTLFTIKQLGIKLTKNIYGVSFGLFLFGLFLTIRTGKYVIFYDYVAILFLCFLLVKIIIKEKFENIRAKDYFYSFMTVPLDILDGFLVGISNMIYFGKKSKNSDSDKHVIKGIFMTIPLLFIFISLFSSADVVFDKFISKILHGNLFTLNGRFISIGFFACFFLGFFFFIGKTSKLITKKYEIEQVTDEKKHIEINIILGSLIFLFTVFILLQINYLFGNEASIIYKGYTYSEYATKGFTELTIVASIIFILFWKIDHYLYNHQKPSNDTILFKRFTIVLIFLTLIILVSAFYRLWLYEKTYGFTEIRFYSYVFIILLGISLFITAYKFIKFIKEGIFLSIIFSCYLLGLFICNILNPESFISRANLVKNYTGSLRMDSYYIGSFSEDAVDNMLKTYHQLKDGDMPKEYIKKQFCNMIYRNKNLSWQEFNFSRIYAYRLLSPKVNEFNCKKVND